MTADIVFRDATVLDGSGDDGYVADVAVTGDRIAAIGQGLREPDVRLTPNGRSSRPGFIDMHAHSDLQILANPDHTAKVSQGVTTEVLGQDGLSFAPVDDATRTGLREQIAGWNGEPEDFDFSWDSVAGYLDRLDEGVACNVGYLVPQGTLRLLVIGHEDRDPDDAELEQMRALLRQGMSEGALGMSSGLTYTPGMYAGTDELSALCAVVVEYGGYYSPHTRSYGATALEAYAEMVEVARRTGCALHLTHATMNFEPNRGRAQEFLDLVDRGSRDGRRHHPGHLPIPARGSTTLSALLPSWSMSGGTEALLERLSDTGREPGSRTRWSMSAPTAVMAA